MKLRALFFSASVFLSAADAAAFPSYGVCAHVTRSERDEHRLKGTLDAMSLAGMGYVRSDFDARAMRRPDGTYDFTNYDGLVDELEKRGVVLLPILYGVENPPRDLAAHQDYVRTVVRHFGRRLPVYEIWNEANIDFFKGRDPVVYARTLKATYETVKETDPSLLVAFTGTAGVPLDWIRAAFAAGATNCFDIMNVHPYSHPRRPEGSMDVKFEELRRLMAEFGVGDKPIWFTEVGWPTHRRTVPYLDVLLAGLKAARPERRTWRIVLADSRTEGEPADQTLARELEDRLPAGSSAVACSERETIRRLEAGEADAVAYPFDETFPADTVDAVNAFVREGGVFIDFGGVPCYYGARDGKILKGSVGSCRAFPFGWRAWWTDKAYPRQAQVFATARGAELGIRHEPTGYKAERFLTRERIGGDAEWIPLLASGPATNGQEFVAAAVIRYHGERKGAAILCSLFGDHAWKGTNSEEDQARYTARGLAIAFAEGVGAYFTYNLRSFERDPYYSEHHFGLMHADFQPKPAFAAYGQFVRMRPEGSVGIAAPWHDAERTEFCVQWTRPDGRPAGVIWKLGADERRDLAFAGGEPEFHDLYGLKLPTRPVSPGVYRLTVGEAPVYFAGATVVPPCSR